MNPAVAFLEGHLAESRSIARIEVAPEHHAAITASGLAAGATLDGPRADRPGCIVVTDAEGGEWTASLPAAW